ncbi:MAG TPA: exo-alpha-sialidase, partial [Micrococcaceae bacterium]|nr:exo-alpha-sialidase [Micrococcaceae bacterium]
MANPETVVLAIGTKKGMWLGSSQDRKNWSFTGPHFFMNEIPSIGIDTRGGRTRIMVGVRSEHWGPTVVHSDDLGETWTEPEQGAITFPEDTGAALERVWQIQPDSAERPGVVWAGCEPISVWKSTDGGEHFEFNRGLWDHPHRTQWGAGYGGAAAHTVLPSPADENTVHVAMSTGGVYRSTDGGESWEARNHGISAYFMPDPNPEFGQCVHKIARDPEVDSRLFAQNHHGVYRSDDNGDSWNSIAEGLPADFGFVMMTHPRRSGTAWVIPLKADGARIPPEGKLAVHRTEDAGTSWT